MAKRDRVCYTCGTKYEYCPSCLSDSLKPTWMFCFCTEECKDVYEVLSNYNTTDSNVTEDDVKKVLNKHKIKDYDKYTKAIQSELKEIVNSTKKNAKKVEGSEEA